MEGEKILQWVIQGGCDEDLVWNHPLEESITLQCQRRQRGERYQGKPKLAFLETPLILQYDKELRQRVTTSLDLRKINKGKVPYTRVDTSCE